MNFAQSDLPEVILYPGVYSLAVSGASLYVGGAFNDYRGAPANSIAKVDVVSGVLDTTFSPPSPNGFDDWGWVYALAPSGPNLLVGGFFTSYRGGAGNAFGLAKLDAQTGEQDSSFRPADSDANGVSSEGGAQVDGIVIAGDSILLSGWFNAYGGDRANGVAKLDDVTYAVDRTFQGPFGIPYADTGEYLVDGVWAMAADSDALYIGGGFLGPASGVAKIDLETGALDTTFSPPSAYAGRGSEVHALAVSGTSLYIGQDQALYQSDPDTGAALLKVDTTTGTLDERFYPAPTDGGPPVVPGGSVTSIAVAGSSLYLAGQLEGYPGVEGLGLDIVKIDATTGALDSTFIPAVNAGFSGLLDTNPIGAINALVVAGSSLFVGGDFTSYGNVAGSANGIAKLDLVSGALDTTFSPPAANGFDQPVSTIAVQGGAVYAGGGFSRYRGTVSTPFLAKLDETTGEAVPGYGVAATKRLDLTSENVSVIGVTGTAVLCDVNGVTTTGFDPVTPLAP